MILGAGTLFELALNIRTGADPRSCSRSIILWLFTVDAGLASGCCGVTMMAALSGHSTAGGFCVPRG